MDKYTNFYPLKKHLMVAKTVPLLIEVCACCYAVSLLYLIIIITIIITILIIIIIIYYYLFIIGLREKGN